MSEIVTTALINGTFAVIVLILGARLSGKVKRVAVDARAARRQVENGHSTNLREEGDERHEQNGQKLDQILEELVGVRRSVRRLFDRTDRHTDQIHEMEITQNPTRFAPRDGKHRGERT